MNELPRDLSRTLAWIATRQIEAGWEPAAIASTQAMAALGCSRSSWRRRTSELIRRGWISREVRVGRGRASVYRLLWERRRPWSADVDLHQVEGVRAGRKFQELREGLPQSLRDYLLSWRDRDPRYYAQLLALYQAG